MQLKLVTSSLVVTTDDVVGDVVIYAIVFDVIAVDNVIVIDVAIDVINCHHCW